MRARNIKPGFFKNEALAECDPLARILFTGLWCMADRAGRLEDRPRRIKLECLGYDECDIEALMGQLVDKSFIIRYEVDGNPYIQVLNFNKHQTPHVKEAPSAIPEPTLLKEEPIQARDIPHADTQPVSDMSPASTGQAPGSHDVNPSDSLIPDSLIADNGFSEDMAPDKPAAVRKPDLLFEAIVQVCYEKPICKITDDERSRANKAAAQLRKIHATPTDVFKRADEYHARSPGYALMPQTLTKAWSSLERPLAHKRGNGVVDAPAKPYVRPKLSWDELTPREREHYGNREAYEVAS